MVTALSIYLECRGDLVRYASGIVGEISHAEDVVQEAYLRFEATLTARAIEEPVAYLYRIVQNLALDKVRRRTLETRIFKPVSENSIQGIAEDRPSPETEVLDRDGLRALKVAIEELPPRTRIALEMHRLGGHTLKDIAAALQISLTAAHELVVEGLNHCKRRVFERN